MPSSRTPLRLSAAPRSLTALLLTACSGGADAGATDAATTGGSAFPVTVEHAFGETTVESADRVVAISWTNQDVALALGVTPVGFTRASYGDEDGDGLLAWTKEALDAAGDETPTLFGETDGIPYEAISDLTPSVILGACRHHAGGTTTRCRRSRRPSPTRGLAWGTTWQDSAKPTEPRSGSRTRRRRRSPTSRPTSRPRSPSTPRSPARASPTAGTTPPTPARSPTTPPTTRG